MIGRTLSHYKVLEKIGEGGMGEVYLAKDTKLDREVAVKVLPATFSENKERLARFEREARLLASLNHPNIAAIHELEESDGVHFLALEYVPGETLAERIKRGPIPIDEALPLFKQIAEGLEAAHEKGVIHRDLKPANIKITPEGKVKVLDFGLAKAMAGETPVQGLSESPTITREHTEAGVLLGTAPYMSPEQARGKAVDKRTDIWAFGCCLYEALTGKAAFLGDTVTDTIAKIVERDPNWDALPVATPALLRSLLRRCLHKDATDRLHDIGDARIEIEEVSTAPQVITDIVQTGMSKGRRTILWTMVALVTLIIGPTAGWYLRPPHTRAVVKLRMGVQPAEQLGGGADDEQSYIGLQRPSRTDLALSPDGTLLVFSGGHDGKWQLYLRRMDQSEASPIPGTESGINPFFSPDGEWLGFWKGRAFDNPGELKKVPFSGGLPVTLCETKGIYGASWGPDDAIVFARRDEGLWRVSAEGGSLEELTQLEEGEHSHRLPQVLPGGEAVLFTILKRWNSWNDAKTEVLVLATGERQALIEGAADARYVPTGHLVYARAGTLMAAPFDPEQLEVTGGSVPVIAGVMQSINAASYMLDNGAAQFSVSESGTLAYLEGGIYPDSNGSLVWVDRKGTVEPLPAPEQPYIVPRLSPDGRSVAVGILRLNEPKIWRLDLSRGTLTPLTHEARALSSVWTPDGKEIVFASSGAGGRSNLFRQAMDGSGDAERLSSTIELGHSPSSWTPEGRELAFLSRGDIWVLPLSGDDHHARPVMETPFREDYPAFSPDGRWLAFASDESGRREVYVQPYPGPGAKTRVSVEGGWAPAWRGDGRELFFRGGEWEVWMETGVMPIRPMMAVDIATDPVFAAGMPRVLFEGNYEVAGLVRNYDVTPDGQRFLTTKPIELPMQPVTYVNIVLNWFEELKRLVPTN